MKHGRYLFYQLKKDLPFLCLMFGIEVLSLASIIIITRTSYGSSFAENFFIYGVIMAFAMAYLFPLVHKAKFFAKRSADLYLSLPLSKKGIYLDDAVLGLGELLVLFLLYYSIGLLFTPLALSGDWIGATWAGYFFLFGLFGILTGYGLSLGITSAANNVLDAVIFLVLALVTMFGLSALYSSLHSYYFAHSSSEYYLLFNYDYVGFPPAALARGLIDRTFGTLSTYHHDVLPLRVNFIHLAIAFLFAIGGYFLSKKWQAELSQTPSMAWYGYPLHCALALTFFLGIDGPHLGQNDTTLLFVVFCIGTLLFAIVYFIGQRKIRLGWGLIISYSASVFFGYGFAAIMMAVMHQLQQGNVNY
jgi:hypothetical protein